MMCDVIKPGTVELYAEKGGLGVTRAVLPSEVCACLVSNGRRQVTIIPCGTAQLMSFKGKGRTTLRGREDF